MSIETPINGEDAFNLHDVTASHGKMQNGELRFRLSKADGTSYIRTEAPKGGGWQNSHYHKKVLETYIVQQGWIGYAESVDKSLQITIYRPGESFTTQPHVIHNVYLPSDAVIHTVKHGDGQGEKRMENSDTKKFTELTKKLSEDNLLSKTYAKPQVVQSKLNYQFDEAYRHFDNLIWQTSAWATAIFALALASANQVSEEVSLFKDFVSEKNHMICAAFLLFSTFLLIISHALYRFRWHQKQPLNRATLVRWRSPQFGLQTMVNIQGAILLSSAPVFGGLPVSYAAVLCVGTMLALMFYQEGKIYGWLWRYGNRITHS